MKFNQTTFGKCQKALEDVLAHRREDKDGNHVLWIGETTFMLCEDALKALKSEMIDETTLPAKK